MKVNRELQRDKLNKDGLALIRLVVSWEGKRLRIGTGCLVQPDHWDARQQLVQMRPGTSGWRVKYIVPPLAGVCAIAIAMHG